jgi:ATP/maltotriose-dependent transcriptional regulator MalT
MLERVLELWPVVPDAGVTLQTDEYSVVVDAAHAATRADDHDRVLALTDRAVVLAGREGDPQRIAESLARRGRRRLHIDMADSVSDIRRALEVLPETPSATRAQALDALAVTLMLRGDTSEATAVAEAAADMAREVSDSLTEVSALITLGTLLVDRGEVDEGLAVTRDALTRAQADDEQLMAARALTNLSHQLGGIGRHREAETVARQGLDVVRSLGLTRTYSPILSSNVVDALIHLGELDEAEAVLQPALTAGGLNAGGLACLGYLAATIAYQRGDLDAADSLLDRTEAGHGDSPLLPQDVLPIAQVRAATALERGDIDRALEIALGELSGSRVGGHTRFYWPLIVVAAEAAAAQAERGAREDTLKSLLDTVEAAADAEPSAGASGVAWSSHVAAALASARGAATAATWIDVASAYNKLEEPFPQGRALLSGAEQAASDGDRATARTLVREADQLATQIGTGLLRTRTNRLARKLGVDLGHDVEPSAAASYGLTDREREVLHRVAEGRTNRQIADDLFISPKTASVHVSNILAKLGVASRGEAAAFAHRHGLN